MDDSSENNSLFKYSVHKLIELVKERPTIWDSTRADFRCFYNKEVAWIEVYEELDSKYRHSDEKARAKIGINITAKWRNVRDAFIRSLKKRAQDSKVKKYMHHDQLSFMLKLFNTDEFAQNPPRPISISPEPLTESPTENITENNLFFNDAEDPILTVIKIEPDQEDNDPLTTVIKIESDDESPPVSYSAKSSRQKRKNVDSDGEISESGPSKKTRPQADIPDEPSQVEETEIEQVLNDIKSENSAEEVRSVKPFSLDEDEAFFGSILSLVRTMTSDEKLEFRISVLQLIRETRNRKRESVARILRTKE